MEIVYKSRTLQRICTDFSAASRKHGNRMASIIQIRIAQIQSADNIESLVEGKVGRCHALKGARAGREFALSLTLASNSELAKLRASGAAHAMDLVHPYRLIFEKQGELIQIARITEIADYH